MVAVPQKIEDTNAADEVEALQSLKQQLDKLQVSPARIAAKQRTKPLVPEKNCSYSSTNNGSNHADTGG